MLLYLLPFHLSVCMRACMYACVRVCGCFDRKGGEAYISRTHSHSRAIHPIAQFVEHTQSIFTPDPRNSVPIFLLAKFILMHWLSLNLIL